MAVLSHQVNFRFNTGAVAKAHGRYLDRKFNKSQSRYKIIPGIIAVDIHENDIQALTDESYGEVVTGKISNGTAGYKALAP